MGDTKSPTFKEEVEAYFDEEYLEFLGEWLKEALESYIELNNAEDEVYINSELFVQCLKDLVSDLVRLCQYHNIKYPNNSKIYSYMASWIVKRKPLQFVDNIIDPKSIFHNENAAYALIITGTGMIKTKYSTNNEEELAKELESISYHIKYRNTDPRTMMLLLDSLRAGVIVSLPSEY